MQYKLSDYRKAKIVLYIIEQLKEIENKDIFRSDGEDEIINKILKRAGWNLTTSNEAGLVDIDEYIQLTYDELEDKLIKKLYPRPSYSVRNRMMEKLTFNVNEELKQLTEKFEKDNIPDSGPCKTLIGEMFRAIQRIQYRVFNDGDLWYVIGSDSFMSYIYLQSMIDKLNWSHQSYNEETGEYKFEFTDSYLQEHSWDGKISHIIESSLAEDAEFIKYQLIDLLSNGKLKDKPNEYDSRSYTKLNKGSRY
jgi:hypothetical protein